MRNRIIFLFALVGLLQVSNLQAQRITLPNGQTPFFSGMNVAWRNFGGDVADTPANLNDWKTVLDNVKASGGNTIRWWLFVNCSQAPKFDANGYVSGLGSQSINNIKAVLDLAQERNMVIILCLFSFDMLQTAQWGVVEANNKKMLQTDAGIKATVDNCVVPLVKAIGNHASILCWEIFNEPEGMADGYGWTPSKVGMYDIQRFINRAAGAIHRAVPGVKVSNGSWNMKVLSNTIGKNYYSDYELKNAGGDADGYLDFYMVHYYNNDGGDNTQHSPFHHPSSYWGLDKPILVAEYAAKGVDNPYLTPKDCFQKVYDGNYAGALSWTYTAHDGLGGLPESTPGIKYLYDNHKADVTITFLKISAEAGANQMVLDANYDGLEQVTLDGSQSKSTSGTISYVWKENGQTIATTVKPSLNLSAGIHTITLTVSDNVNPSVSDEVIITVKAPSLAYKKPVVVSSTEAVYGNIATNANDGNSTTRWSSIYADSQWIYVDLLDIYSISSITLNWEIANAKSYNVEFSLDAQTWTNPISKVALAAGARIDVLPVNVQNARYVRVTGLTRNTLFGYSLYEFEIYGVKAPTIQTIQLQKGWNLISTNVSVSDNSIQSIFAGLDLEQVKTANGFWKKGLANELQSLTTIKAGEGYLVKMNVAGYLIVSGIPLSSVNFPLSIKTGWNLIGCSYQTETSLLSVFNTTNSKIIKNFDGFWDPIGSLNSLTNLVPGKGYFILK